MAGYVGLAGGHTGSARPTGPRTPSHCRPESGRNSSSAAVAGGPRTARRSCVRSLTASDTSPQERRPGSQSCAAIDTHDHIDRCVCFGHCRWQIRPGPRPPFLGHLQGTAHRDRDHRRHRQPHSAARSHRIRDQHDRTGPPIRVTEPVIQTCTMPNHRPSYGWR